MTKTLKTFEELEEIISRLLVLFKKMDLDQEFNFAYIELGLLINILKAFREYVEFKQAKLTLEEK